MSTKVGEWVGGAAMGDVSGWLDSCYCSLLPPGITARRGEPRPVPRPPSQPASQLSGCGAVWPRLFVLAGSGRTLRVCYLRHAYGLGEHYESVVPGLVAPEDDGEADADAGEGEPAAAADAEAEAKVA